MCINKRDKLQAPSEQKVAELSFSQMNYPITFKEGKRSHQGEVNLQQSISATRPLYNTPGSDNGQWQHNNKQQDHPSV